MLLVAAVLTFPVSANIARTEESAFEAAWKCTVGFHLFLMTGR
jgi:hypothetical protein